VSNEPHDKHPVAIGGVGGSGTRVVANILRGLGYYVGSDLNHANDNTWFTLLFKRVEFFNVNALDPEFQSAVRVFTKAMTGRNDITPAEKQSIISLAVNNRLDHDRRWLADRVKTLLGRFEENSAHINCWGWKEPNTHVFLPSLLESLPRLKYIHVMRNGLDIALSKNQNQMKNWGQCFLPADKFEISPRFSLKYWCVVQKRITNLAQQHPNRVLILNFDELSERPEDGVQRMCHFLQTSSDNHTINNICLDIHRPDSIGRFRRVDIRNFDSEDVAYVANLGFDIK